MKVFLLVILVTVSNFISAQNLVSNEGFETYSALPNGVGQYANAIGWNNCNGGGSPDYFHMNGSGQVDLPVCFIGTLYPYSGDGIMGFSPYYQGSSEFREYVSSELTSALIAGNSYSVSFYVTCGINSGAYCGQGIDKLSVAFSVGQLTQPGSGVIPFVNPQWTTPGILYDTAWEQITFQFIAADAYDHITFGNFVGDASTNVQTFVPASFPGAYYFIDGIEVQPDSVSQMNFIASDTSLCEKFCISFIDQSNNNPVAWQWLFPGGNPSSSTAQNPTQICYQSPGVFDVTLITTNANGNDTLTLLNYVTVNATPPFPTIAQNGYTLASSPAYSYQWQLNTVDIPGATNQSYNVLQSGLYTVIVGDSNGCVNSANTYVLISGLAEIDDAGISIYPNPSSGSFTVQWLNAQLAGAVSIDVVNTLGQKVFSSIYKIYSSSFKKEIDLSDVAGGVYFIEIKSPNIFACPDFIGLKKKIIITN